MTAEEAPVYPQDGACLNDGDPDAWFPTGPADALGERTRHAMAVCHVCPVKVMCGQRADERREEFGVWGGELHTRDRVRRMKRRQERVERQAMAAAGLPAHLAVCAECPTEMSGTTLGEVTAMAGKHTDETGHAWTYSGPQAVSA